MSGTSVITSSSISIAYTDVLSLQLSWSGQPQGTFDLQGSIDAIQWASVPLSPAAAASGSGSFLILINTNNLAYPLARVVYTNSTASGTLSCWLNTKGLG